ncbi:cyclase family protein [Kangiella shandongensis]|uniref:cyclase family protein n=1 Tax=Kangiella shandongensis TaxID=2763258 RepID=UPI001CC16824|nr:cyclase family protein [Kangiella shandongensis]
MSTFVEFDGHTYQLELSQASSIAIPLAFDKAQPNHFGANQAKKEILQGDGFIGDTSKGGSCNVSSIEMVPHCNGTHTETVHHIIDELVPVGNALTSSLTSCYVLSVTPQRASDTNEHYRPNREDNDLLITRQALEQELSSQDLDLMGAVAIRTLPNTRDKRSRVYGESEQPPFFSTEAIEWLSQSNIHHLLVDFPSIDKMFDEGQLHNHHTFWNVPHGTHQLTDTTLIHRTITEMVFVDDDITDGLYWLNLQLPHFQLDAAPSRPVLYPLTDITEASDV